MVSQYLEACVGPGYKPLSCGLFITGCAVDLAGEIETADFLGLKCWAELYGRTVIVFDGVPRADNFGLFQAGNGVDELGLNVKGKAGRQAVYVIFPGVPSFRFEKELVLSFFRRS